MATECSYDYIFVFDGDSYKSPLLGSFSGKTEPQQVVATSGSVSQYRNLYKIRFFIALFDVANNWIFVIYFTDANFTL